MVSLKKRRECYTSASEESRRGAGRTFATNFGNGTLGREGPIIVTLLTDFGTRDAYVASMNGVILGIAPQVTIVDITHEIPPQDVAAGAFILSTAYSYFPTDTIHVAVVDPGVGTSRRVVLLETPQGRFLAPDNGLLTHVLDEESVAYALENRSLFLSNVSQTFHGRDVFAPVAARLANGLPSKEVGPRITDLQTLPVPKPEALPNGGVAGTVVHVDAFGNLITNVLEMDLPKGLIRIQVGRATIMGLSGSYQSGADLLAIIGSHGRLEIAARNGSAAALLGLGRGSGVSVERG